MRIRRKPLHGLPTANVRISRGDLRRVLLDAAVADADDAWQHSHVRWGSQCQCFTRLDDGRLRVIVGRRRSSAVQPRQMAGKGELNRDDGDESQRRVSEDRVCDLLVAADGAHSKLRPFVRPGDKLEYVGAVLRGGLSLFEEGSVPSPPGRDWGFVVSDGGVSCFVSPVDSRTVFWAVGNLERDPVLELRSGSNRDDEAEAAAPAAVIGRVRELGAVFGERFATLTARTEPKTVFCTNARDKRPFAHDDILARGWPVLFIGDSNHALSPFAGFGANLALADGWDLAEQLCRAKGGSLAEAVAAYDALSGPRANRVLAASRRTMRAAHGAGWWAWLYWVVLVAGRCAAWIGGMVMGAASAVACWRSGGAPGAGARARAGARAGGAG
ncbi:FAD binding domain-containing protein [Hirsutella rhossiliensis]|uniref:FAD binding domain-containing protein n=1 Tax=Hirsutella rhossiliensis TaxID=111463 RepID=A0A9P8SJ18_9HYPO|nr:FAD binding domain-containing protein [Hirsutella rhossiliensis]KAH0964818.1 FAD binding domain-containing protein [Hirsutella rhossiliensis]